MPSILLLTDYKGNFGEKRYSVPYRSGMDLDCLTRYFNEAGFDVTILGFSKVDFSRMAFGGQYVLYTSAQDIGCLYKSYIEDVCLALTMAGAVLIPEYKYLRAHHNKVFMEMLRDLLVSEPINNIKSYHFGTLEELARRYDMRGQTYVIKKAEGAQGRYVQIAKDANELLRRARKISRSRSILHDLKDLGRAVKHRGYIRESRNRRKFIVQDFIPGLSNDWKILVFGNKCYVLHRAVRDNDFRASGSGKFHFKERFPDGMLDFAWEVFQSLLVPNVSMDVAFDGDQFYLLEFQCIYFGSTAIEKAPFYFVKCGSGWRMHRGVSVLEREYVNSVVGYLERLERLSIQHSAHD